MNAAGLSKRQQLALSKARAQERRSGSDPDPDEAPRLKIVELRKAALTAERQQAVREKMPSGDQAAIKLNLLEHARLPDDSAVRHHVLKPTRSRPDSRLRKDLRGIVTLNSEEKGSDVLVPLPWQALHEATAEIAGVRNPAARLDQLYFLSRAYNVTREELANRLEQAGSTQRTMQKRLLAGPAAVHLQTYFGAVAKSLRPDDFDDKDQQKPNRDPLPHSRGGLGRAVARGEYILDAARRMKVAFAAARDGGTTKDVERSYADMQAAVKVTLTPKPEQE